MPLCVGGVGRPCLLGHPHVSVARLLDLKRNSSRCGLLSQADCPSHGCFGAHGEPALWQARFGEVWPPGAGLQSHLAAVPQGSGSAALTSTSSVWCRGVQCVPLGF